MRSTLIPWLFFGPLFAMMGSYAIWTVSKWPAAKWLAIGSLIWIIAFGLVAFLANYFRK